ncbi:MAG: FMN-binding protein [Planctomycetota bacterium]
MANSVLKQAWLVLVLAVCFGSALAGVHVALSPRIEENRRAEVQDAIPILLQGAVPESAERTELGGRRVYKGYDAEGDHLGWVVHATGQGFGGPVELLIGLDQPAERITGIYVLLQTETPGLGTGITEQDWREQFEGIPASGGVTLVKEKPSQSDEIQAITGATVSSQSVCDIVNSAVADVRAALADGDSVDEGASGDE